MFIWCLITDGVFVYNELTFDHIISTSLGPLVGKIKEYHVDTIVDKLCSNMMSTNEQLRDISSIGNV